MSAEAEISARAVPASAIDGADRLLIAGLTLVTTAFVASHLNHPIRPMEDASMLLRYSQNLAAGDGIVWNVGDHPVEGATDFLFMVLIGALSRVFHAGVQKVAEVILFVSHVISVAVLYAALRRFYRATRLLATGFGLILGLGLGYHFVNTAFSAPFYALFALLTWCVGLLSIERGVTWQRAILFSLLAFTTGLIRPDGVILACLILLSTVFGSRQKRLPLILTFGIVFGVFGGLYFAWRIHYFGYPFPNPFYVKSAGGLKLYVLKLSWRNITEMLLLVLPFAGFALRTRESVRRLMIWLITLVPFACVWILISNDNNHFSRFQYVLVPLSLLELGGFAATWWFELKLTRPAEAAVLQRPISCVWLLLVAASVFYNMHLYLLPFSNAGAQELAERLRPLAPKGYTMLTTEAGDLPFYSQWRAVDLLGLNDASIAHHGGVVTQQYLDEVKPDLIIYRDLAWPMRQADLQAAANGGIPTTTNQLTLDARAARDYAMSHGYILAAKLGGRNCDTLTFWVKPNLPDTAAILSDIRDHPYYSQVYGELSYDFRDAPPPTFPCLINR
jgi:arabinofuranosyltransferase